MKDQPKMKLSYESDGKMGKEQNETRDLYEMEEDMNYDEKMFFNVTQGSE